MIRDQKIREWFSKNKDHKRNEATKILGVEYAHLRLDSNDDLYITAEGMPFIDNLRPENFFTDKAWFEKNSRRLSGTGCIYKVKTKRIGGIEKDIVIKWNRMGQDIPGAGDCEELMYSEFNSPFEEFALVAELRGVMCESSPRVTIHKPLAIYVPSERVELWQTGRKEYKMQYKIKSHTDITLDIHRSSAVIYEWIEGIDSAEAFGKKVLGKKLMEFLTIQAGEELKENGFVVKDNKPHHIIVKPAGKRELLKDREKMPYGLIDFELLERTPKSESIIKKDKRRDYLKRQRDRFIIEIPNKFHPHLHHVNIFGVDYVYGHVESTKGRLWIAGRDPYLFDYFLPERWKRIPKTKISVYSEMYHSVTKDNIHLVWKVSKVGFRPDLDPFKEDEKKIIEYGYNSPFEEVALAVELDKLGIPAIYPRAIYMSEFKTGITGNPLDSSRYKSHAKYKTPDAIPILKKKHDYIIIWGYWNGPDEKLAEKDGDYYEWKDALRVYKDNIITQTEYIDLLRNTKKKLSKVGIIDLNLRGDHILISFDSKKRLITDSHNMPEVRICNFEFLKRRHHKK